MTTANKRTLDVQHATVSLPSRWLSLLLVLLISVMCCESAYIVDIPAKDEECFFLTATKSPGTYFGNYDLLDDTSKSADAVSVVIMDAKTYRIYYRSRRGASEGNFKVEVSAGQSLQLCIQNGIWSAGKRKQVQNKPHDGEDRTVGFQFSFEEKNPAMELQSQTSKLISSSRSLGRELGRLQDHYNYMRAREAKHRETVESTFSRLMSWTLLEGCTVIFVACGQI
eukprot:CAMPEP_0176012078 /NCGR_PEP_ID=MMETSP0120_2-20121206/5611_1 /TAXON_ID=160619 /ORGANISM="Kryptoperidinium foliaceum, Strain CCMP 1326" /LENGTH=224 /DNA_ID=CAMNT_0017344955 /DNA_START=181 /DNA_END=852 /DNA_ORIENTATION=-